MEKLEAKQGAQTSLQQLGGGQFVMMTGAKWITFDSQAEYPNVSFKILGSPKATHVKIELDWSDTYKMTFYKIRGTVSKVVAEHVGIYNDMLQDIFTKETGLNCTLGTLGR